MESDGNLTSKHAGSHCYTYIVIIIIINVSLLLQIRKENEWCEEK